MFKCNQNKFEAFPRRGGIGGLAGSVGVLITTFK